MHEIMKIFIIKSSANSISYLQPTVKLVDALSTVGGVWGLWIGLSVSVIVSIGIGTLKYIYEPTSSDSHLTKHKTSKNHFKEPQSTINQMHENNTMVNYSNLPQISVSSQNNHLTLIHDMLWWTGVVAITLVYIWQTYLTINDYLQFKVIQLVNTELQDNNSFPTVYACSSTDLFYNSSIIRNDTDLFKKVYYLQSLLDKKLVVENGRFYRENFTDSERLSLLPSVGDFVLSCAFYSETGRYVPCRLEEKRFLGLEMFVFVPIVCGIISPILPQIKNTIVKNLVLQLKYPQNVATFSQIVTRIGFDPFSMLNNIDTDMPLPTHEVTPGNHVIFKYSMIETNRLPYPYTSKCVPSNTIYNIWPNKLREFGANLTYSYTFKKIALGHYNSISELNNYMWSGISVVNVERESAYKTVKTEKPAVQPDSLVGIIGGISGLWIGQSLLNFFVEFQRLITFLFNKLTHKSFKPKIIKT